MRELYIEEVKPELEKDIKYKVIKRFYDVEYNVCITKIKLDELDEQLEVGKVYAFNYIDDNDSDTYHYIILKQEDEDIYYIAEYYGKLLVTRESQLVEGYWEKINAEELGIDLYYII